MDAEKKVRMREAGEKKDEAYSHCTLDAQERRVFENTLPKANTPRGFLRKYAKKIIFSLLALILILSALFYLSLPDVSALKKMNPEKTAMMELREAEWAKAGKKRRINRIWVPYSAISQYAVKAVIIAEDDKFWSHEGFDFEAIQKAIEKDLKSGKFKSGGSTISQQLAKNLYLSPRKTPWRKIKEAVITWRIERELSKKRIIELYMNCVEWGDGIFGIEAASRRYFGKGASALTPLEASRLAAVLPNPRRFNPVGDQRYVANRANIIHSVMVRRGIVLPEFEEAEEEGAQLAQPESRNESLKVKAPGEPVLPSSGAEVDDRNKDKDKEPVSGGVKTEKEGAFIERTFY